MPSTTPSLPSTPTSSLTTSNPDREYLICQHSDGSAWYGYYEQNHLFWSGWQDTLIEAVSLSFREATDTNDPERNTRTCLIEYCQKERPTWTITPLDDPITVDTHPEYFI